MAIYLDHAAATPIDADVLAAMQPFFVDQFYNPSALYGPAVAAAKALETARADCAQVIGAKPSEIIFTAGGTEANNLAIHGVMRNNPDAILALSAIEHDSVRVPAARYQTVTIPVTNQGVVDYTSLSSKINNSVVLVSVMYANNEVGTVQPIRRIAGELEVIRKARQQAGNPLPLYFHVDAAQAGNYLDLHVHRLGVDLLTINGGKLYGPKQSGLLYIRSGVSLQPLVEGGGQERNLRSGTENVAQAAGLAKSLQIAVAKRHDENKRQQALQVMFIDTLTTAFPQAIINGSLKQRLPNNVHLTLPGTDNERLLMALDIHDIYAAAGSACSASHDEPSHVLQAMGFDVSYIQSSVRFSTGRSTTVEEIEQTVQILRQILD
ncbi:MAG: cysteine desulfurase family protein [Candidatus Saccharimonadales bacterium]